MIPIPDLPPVNEEITADASGYLAALEAMIAMAERAAEANAKLMASLRADAAAENDAASAAAKAGTAQKTAADGARDAAAAAAANAAAQRANTRATDDSARQARIAAMVYGGLAENQRVVIATSAAMRAAEDTLKDATEALAAAEAFCAEEAGKLAGMQSEAAVASFKAAMGADAAAEGADAAAKAFVLLGQAEAFQAGEAAKAAAIAVTLKEALGGDSEAARAFAAGMVAAGMSTKALTAGTAAAGQAALTAGGRWGFLAGRVALFGGLTTITWFHLLADAVIETAAVVIPATIAFGAFAVAGRSAAVDIYNHMQAVNTVVQATGRNIYPMSGAFAQLQARVAPQVYTLFGEALNVINSHMGEFRSLAVGAGAALDQLGARAAAALGSAGMGRFLHNAVSDLSQIGTLIGNVFGILGNLLKSMTSIAEHLLGALVGITHALEVFTSSGIVQGILKVALGLHGLFIWGGLAATGLVRMASWITGTVAPAVTNFAVAAVTRLAATRAAFAAAGGGAAGLGAGLETLTGIPVWGWVAAGAVALVGLTYWLSKVGDSTQVWANSFQNAIDSQKTFQGVIGATRGAISQVNDRMAQTPKYVQVATTAFRLTGQTMQAANYQYHDLSSASARYQTELGLEHFRLNELVGTFGSVAGAQAAFNAIGIKSSDIGKASHQQWVQDVTALLGLSSAYRAMGQSASQSGADVFVVGHAADDQVKAVQALNQAWDTYTQVASAGMQASIQAAQGFHTLTADAKATGASFLGVNKSSLQLRGDFQQQVTSIQGVIDAMRSAHASTRAEAEVVSTFLTPALRGNALAARGNRDQIYELARQAGYTGPNAIKPLSAYLRDNATSLRKATNEASAYAGKNASLQGAVQNLTTSINALIRTLGGAVPKMRDAGTQGVGGLAGALTAGVGKVTNAAAGMVSGAVGKVNGLQGAFHTAGVNAGQGLANGITASIGAIATAAQNAVNVAKQMVQQGLQTHSPSRWAQQQGQWFGQGLIQGLTGTIAQIRAAARKLADAVRAAFHQGIISADKSSDLTAWIAADNAKLQALANQRQQILAQIQAATARYQAMQQLYSSTLQGLLSWASLTNMPVISNYWSYLQSKQSGSGGAGGGAGTPTGPPPGIGLLSQSGSGQVIVSGAATPPNGTQNGGWTFKNGKWVWTGTSGTSGSGSGSGGGSGSTPPPPKPTAKSIIAGLKAWVAKLKHFGKDLQELAKLGLDKSILEQLIQAGPDEGSMIADAILAEIKNVGGKGKRNKDPNIVGGSGNGVPSIIQQLNQAQNAIDAVSKKIAAQNVQDYYGMGLNAAKALIKGLKSQEKAIEEEMKKIADTLVKRLKHDLKIKSPSMVMHEHGLAIAEGLAKGIRDGAPLVDAAWKYLEGVFPGGPAHLHARGGDGAMIVPPTIPLAPAGGVNPGGPMNHGGPPIIIHVHGHVMHERDLSDLIRKLTQEYTRRNHGNGYSFPGRTTGVR